MVQVVTNIVARRRSAWRNWTFGERFGDAKVGVLMAHVRVPLGLFPGSSLHLGINEVLVQGTVG